MGGCCAVHSGTAKFKPVCNAKQLPRAAPARFGAVFSARLRWAVVAPRMKAGRSLSPFGTLTICRAQHPPASRAVHPAPGFILETENLTPTNCRARRRDYPALGRREPAYRLFSAITEEPVLKEPFSLLAEDIEALSPEFGY